MAVAQDPTLVHKKITSSLGAMPPIVHHLMMFNYYTVAEKVGLDRLYPRLLIVMDTNQVLSFMIARGRGKSHPLDQLLVDEYAYIAAPDYIEFEIANHMNEISDKKGIDLNELWSVWNSEIKPRIDVQSYISRWAYQEATRMVDSVDPDDIPFLALYLDIGADVILSYDNHIRSIVGTSAWTPGRAKWASVRIREGVVSLFVIHPIGSNAARALGIIAWALLDTLFWIINAISEGIQKGIRSVTEWFLDLPDWLQMVIFGGALAFYFKHQDAIAQWIDNMIDRLVSWVNLIAGFLERVISWSIKWSKFLGGLLMLLLKSVLECTDELIQLRYLDKFDPQYRAF